jgi:outer membrane protein assembly factor BamE (lipoprotein component of BamABCDE complex)
MRANHVIQRVARRCARTTSVSILTASWLLVSGCTGELNTHGDLVEADRLAQIVPHQNNRNDVLSILGSPSTVSALDGEAWYYIGNRTAEKIAFLRPEVKERQAVVITFNSQGVVESVRTLKSDKDREVQVVERETPTTGSDLTMIEQFLGNLGRFNKDTEPPR